MTAAVVVSTAVIPASTWQPDTLPGVPAAHSVPGERQPVIPVVAEQATKQALNGSPSVSWPGAGEAEVDLAGAATRAGDLPIWVGDRTGTVKVQLLDRQTTEKAGVQGLLFRVTGVGGALSVGVDYGSFRHAFGGDWATRLGLVRLPECALTRPDCAGRMPVESRNDSGSGKVTANVVLPGADDVTVAQGAGPAGGLLLAVTAASESAAGQGDYSATPLAPSATWQVSQQTGDFSWSYPLKPPPAPGGLAPTLAVGYSSSRIDGHTASTNNQSSWLGEGWDMWSGYIERRFTSCAENTDDVALKTADKCWFDENASLVLGGSGGQLVRDDASGVWRLKNDDGSKVERLTGAANGDRDGEYWRITKSDGTQYYFGRNRLDGWTDGKPETRSAWTVPVFGRHSGQPCNAAAFKDSWCQRAWRWNLDHVVDKHGNTMTYYYNPETNFYGRNKNEAASEYTRGGTIDRIEYGTRLGQEYNGAPASVKFDTAERCVSGSACNLANAADFPDVPVDQKCDGGTCPDRISPTFWSTKRLTKVITRIGTQDVESWSLNHSFPDTGDSSSAALWLTGITHAGHVGGTATLPEVTFDGKRLPNRVGSADGWGGYLGLHKYRLTRVYSEAGGLVALDYHDGDCDRSTRLPSSVDTNSYRCFPVTWAPPQRPEFVDWFHKYVVKEVVETDRVGGAPDQKSTYSYVGDPAWHYTEDEITPERLRTWSEWRGYERVKVTKGNTQTEKQFFRGMNGDRLAGGGTKSVQLTDSQGGVHDDWPAAQGFQREEITRDGPNGAALITVITSPWTRGPTAKRGKVEAWITKPGQSRTFTALAAGGHRSMTSTPSFNDDGAVTQIDDRGDDATGADDLCTKHTLANNDDRWIRNVVVRTETVGKTCGEPVSLQDDLIKDSRTFFDGSQTLGQIPGVGNATKAEVGARVENGAVVHQQASRASYDAYGRVTDSWDELDRGSTTSYEHTAGLLTRQTITNAKGFSARIDLNPAWGQPSVKTDANNGTTTLAYDPLGRLATVLLPGRDAELGPNVKFDYQVRKDDVTAVSTTSVTVTNAKITSFALYDGLLRPRQTQAPAPYTGRQITDTFYDDRGLVGRTASVYYNNASLPSATLVKVPAGNEVDLPSQTINTYDPLGRQLTQTFRGLGVDKWTSSTSYGGDRVMVTPPPGGTATTTLTDARGRTSELWQHKAPAPTGDKDVTRYAYTRDGQLRTITDPVGNTWTNTYDLLGRKTAFDDPDRGRTTSEYDAAGQLKSTTDSMNKTLRYDYDELGRKTAVHEGQTKLAGWTYDTRAKGMLTSSTRYSGGHAYTTEVTGYDAVGRPTGVKAVIPAVEGKLAGSYETKTTYAHDGSIWTVDMPAAGGLAAEKLQYLYTKTGQPSSLSAGLTPYVEEATYNEYGQLSSTMLDTGISQGTKWVQQTYTYEADTRRLSQAAVVRNATTNKIVSQAKYRYDATGNITSVLEAPTNFTTDADGNITSLPNGNPSSVDYQCFQYDHVRQLTEAWAGTSRCASSPSLSAVGGPAGYWQSFSYDKAGNRTAEVEHAAAGDTTSTYAYQAAGGHTLRSVTSNGPSGQQLQSFDYDSTGNMKSRLVSGSTHDMKWDSEGHLASDTAGGQTTSFIYDADGNRLLRKAPGGTTLYLAGQELRLDAGTQTVFGTRSYSFGGQIVAVRTKAGLSWMAGDHQGTQQVSLAATTLDVKQRRQSPFGEARGSAPVSWPEEKGFVGGTVDASVGLTHLGAREYDASTGRFISADPIMVLSDPQQINGYAYGNSSPITFSDPTGLKREDERPICVGIYGDCGIDSTTLEGSAIYGEYTPEQLAAMGPNVLKEQKRQALAAAGISDADYARAKELERQSWLDVALEAGGELLKEVLGINDMVKCFGEGDFGACASMVLGALPWGKILQAGKIVKALDRAVSAVKTFMKQQEWAKNLLGRAQKALSGKCNSFMPETQVLMADGSRKPLASVQVGDKVVATDPETGRTEAKTVANVIIGQGEKHLVEITVDTDGSDGASTGSVTATDGHPFWLPDDQRWVKADELWVGSQLKTSAGAHVRVTALKKWTAQEQVYNLMVADIHTYYVASGATDLLNHNCSEQEVADKIQEAFPDRNVRQNRDVYREDGSQLTDHDVYDDDFICEVACGTGKGKVSQMQDRILPSANGTRVAVYGPNLKGSVVKGIEAQGVPVFRRMDDLISWVGPKP